MIEIYAGDCRDLAELVPTCDVMLCDPPYRAHVHKAATSQSKKGGTRHRDLGFVYLSPQLRRTIAGFATQVKRWSLIYSDVESTNVWRHSVEAQRGQYIRTVPWIRWSMPQLTGDRPPQGVEMLTCYWPKAKGAKSWNGPGNLVELEHEADLVLRHNCLRGDEKHKCEKPLDQALDLVSWFTEPGETVFDPTCGRGTFGLACRLLGRKFIGAEIDPVEAEKAAARCKGRFLSDRDEERAHRFVDATLHEAKQVTDKFPPAFQRAQRRLADAEKVHRSVLK